MSHSPFVTMFSEVVCCGVVRTHLYEGKGLHKRQNEPNNKHELLKRNARAIIPTDSLIDWGLTPFIIFFQSYHGDQFTYSCVSRLSYTSTQPNILSKQLAALPYRL